MQIGAIHSLLEKASSLQHRSVVLNLGVVLPREIPLHKVFVVTVAEEELVVLLVIGIDSNKHLVVCQTDSIKDLSTLNAVALLLRNTCNGRPACGILLLLLPPLVFQPPPLCWHLLITISLHLTLF